MSKGWHFGLRYHFSLDARSSPGFCITNAWARLPKADWFFFACATNTIWHSALLGFWRIFPTDTFAQLSKLLWAEALPVLCKFWYYICEERCDNQSELSSIKMPWSLPDVHNLMCFFGIIGKLHTSAIRSSLFLTISMLTRSNEKDIIVSYLVLSQRNTARQRLAQISSVIGLYLQCGAIDEKTTPLDKREAILLLVQTAGPSALSIFETCWWFCWVYEDSVLWKTWSIRTLSAISCEQWLLHSKFHTMSLMLTMSQLSNDNIIRAAMPLIFLKTFGTNWLIK